ncbi:MAG: hypothetical protein AB7V39_22405, partial [Nitrospiraceae bacterium]
MATNYTKSDTSFGVQDVVAYESALPISNQELAALVPSPRVNLTRYHGVLAPNHRLREQVTPARRGRRGAETT